MRIAASSPWRHAFLLALLLTLAACATSNRGTLADPDRDASVAFAVTALEGRGTYTPVLTVSHGDGETAVAVSAVDAEQMQEALLHLEYDGARYTPERVEFGGFLGGEGQVVTLAITDLPDVVPLGVVQVGSAQVAPRAGAGELATVFFRATPFVGGRQAAQVPTGTYNAVDDLKIISQDSGTATLWWTEKNVGDYNNDSLVGVADLTPLGIYYEQEVATSSDPLRVGLADGNGDGRVTVADITQIGANFGNQLTGYKLYTDAAGGSEYGSSITVLREDFDDDPLHPIEYSYVANVPVGYTKFTVRPVADGGAEVGPVSIAAEVADDPGAPDPPSNVTATSDAGTGHQTVRITWSPSPSADVSTYVVERRLVSDGSWGAPLEVGNVTSYVDTDSDLLEQPYDYRVHARDFGGAVSTYAYSNEVTPYFVAGPPAPHSVVADNQLATANAIEVRWEAPADDSLVSQYKVLRKAQGENEFSDIATRARGYRDYTDTGLTPGWYYEYYVISVGAEASSEPSNVAGNTPSVYAPEIHILSLTTDKTTHLNSGTEPAANLTVTTDETPDSVDWSATAGTVIGADSTATWAPTAAMNPAKVTVTCTVHKGSVQDTATLDLFVTDDAILTEFGDNGMYMTGAPSDELLEKLTDGGDLITGRQFEYYMTADRVTWLGTFDTS